MNYKPSNDENIFRPVPESAPSGFVKLKTKAQLAKEAIDFFSKKENIKKIKTISMHIADDLHHVAKTIKSVSDTNAKATLARICFPNSSTYLEYLDKKEK